LIDQIKSIIWKVESIEGIHHAKLDPIRDRAVVRAFGGRDFTIDFDGCTKVMRAEMAVSTREIRPGARIYADTIVVNARIFAKTIRIEPSPAVGEVRGQVTNYDPTTGVLSVRDALSPEPLRVHITPETAIRGGDRPAQASQLAVGTLVKIGFRGGAEGAGQAQKVDILAQPGSTFTFAGKITFVDVRTGYVAIADRAEGNSYEVAVDRLTPKVKLRLKEGTDVIIHAQFDGQKYRHRRSSQHQVGATDVSAGLFRDYKIIGCSAHPPYRAGSFGRGSLDRAICSG